MFVLYAKKNGLSVLEREPVTSGAMNANAVRFEFSPDWDGLSRTAVFQSGSREVSVLLDRSGTCVVPWEVLTQPGRYLIAGVYGKQGEELVLPTVWAALGMVWEGTEPGEPSAPPPTPALWEQQLDAKGDSLAYTDAGELGLYAGRRLLAAVPAEGGAYGAATEEEVAEMLDEVFGHI